jgi:hypothetical protein
MPEYYLGIDTGWSVNGDTTGLCLITLDQNRIRWKCCNTGSREDRRREDLKKLIERGTILNAVGIDGQLTWGLKLIDHYRAADALLTDGAFNTRFTTQATDGRNDHSFGPDLHRHTTRLAKLVLKLSIEGCLNLVYADHPDPLHEYRIVEAFPSAFLAFLLPDEDFQTIQGRGAYAFWESVVDRGYLSALIQLLLPEFQLGDLDVHLRQIENQGRDGHRRDAFVCALTAMCVAKNKYVAVGDPEYGDIMLPPRNAWGYDATGQHRWAETALRNNVGVVSRNEGNHLQHDEARVIRNGRQWMPKP